MVYIIYMHVYNNIPQLTIYHNCGKVIRCGTYSGSVEGDSKTFLQGMVTVGLFRRLWVFSGQCFRVCAASPLAPQSGQV